MKGLLVVILSVSGVLSEAPYPPSGWRPDGPAFALPQRAPAQVPLQQKYLPAVEPRRPVNPNYDNGVDVSVQGLPTQEEQALFQLSPVNGQQYTGPSVNTDIRNLRPSLEQLQYQQQLQKAQEFARQRELEARSRQPSNGLPNIQTPREIAQPSRKPESNQPEPKSYQPEPTTEPLDLNEGEELDENQDQKEKVSVEVSKQNIQEYPSQLLLSPLAQQQLVPLQFGQLQAQYYYQPSEQQGFDGPAHLAALPSILAQKQLETSAENQYRQSPIVVQEPLNQQIISQYQPQALPQSAQPVILQTQGVNQLQPNFIQFAQANQYEQSTQYAQPSPDQQVFVQSGQYAQPNQFAQPSPVAQANYQPSQYPQPNLTPQASYQPNQFAQPNLTPQVNYQPNQFAQPNPQSDTENIQPIQSAQPQLVYQTYQPQFYQPNPYQAGQFQDPNQYQQVEPSQFQNPDALQSGLNDQQDNGLEGEDDRNQESDDGEGSKATAVATAFGARTQPRVVSQYGAPVPTYQTTTEQPQDENTDDNVAVAQATAVANGRRKSSKLRQRRVRPVFTLDRSGHLVLAQEQ